MKYFFNNRFIIIFFRIPHIAGLAGKASVKTLPTLLGGETQLYALPWYENEDMKILINKCFITQVESNPQPSQYSYMLVPLRHDGLLT